MLFLEDESVESYEKLMNEIIELDNDDAKYLEFINRPNRRFIRIKIKIRTNDFSNSAESAI